MLVCSIFGMSIPYAKRLKTLFRTIPLNLKSRSQSLPIKARPIWFNYSRSFVILFMAFATLGHNDWGYFTFWEVYRQIIMFEAMLNVWVRLWSYGCGELSPWNKLESRFCLPSFQFQIWKYNIYQSSYVVLTKFETIQRT